MRGHRDWRTIAIWLLRRALESLTGTGPVLTPEYRLDLRPRWGWGEPVMQAVEAILAAGASGYGESIADVCALADWARLIPVQQRLASEPCWANTYWGSIDALVQCAALKRRNPALYVEVGSGYSTLFARKAIVDFGLRTKIVSIDPEPRAQVSQVCDEVVRHPLQDIDLAIFDRLAPGDVVLFDASHVALMNSDSTIFLLDVLPRVAPGVLIGIDDICLPWDYPPGWEGRIYGEQYLVAAHLLGGAAGWDVRFPAWWIVECSPLAERFAPVWPVVENSYGRHAGSFWLQRV